MTFFCRNFLVVLRYVLKGESTSSNVLLRRSLYSHRDKKVRLTIIIRSMEDENERIEEDEADRLFQQEFAALGNDYSEETFTFVEGQGNTKAQAKAKKKIEGTKRWKEVMKQNLGHAEFPNLRIFRSRNLTDATAVFKHNAWDNVQWDEEMQACAVAKVLKNAESVVDQEKQIELEENAHSHWDKFYGVHQNKFFRDRSWLFSEFPELKSPFGCSVSTEESIEGIKIKRQNESYAGENSKFKVLEIGCGAGNTIFPLLFANNHPETYVYACDFSSTAVAIVQNHDKFESDRCTAFVLDATSCEPCLPFPLGSIDAITMIFVISAISPEKFDQVLKNLFSFLKPGGIVLFRDYGRYDMAQLRFKAGRCISENFYFRGDGTRVYFFTEDEVTDLFQRNGFVKETLLLDKRLQVNRGKQLKMYRVWLQGKFKKPE